MLQAIKRSVASPWLRYALFGLLVVSFGVWGIGDVLRGALTLTRSALVEGRGFEITEQHFLAEWSREQRLLSAQGFDAALLEQSPLPRAILQRMIMREILGNEAKRQKVPIPSSVVQQTIAANPAFLDEEQRFSATRFAIFLQETGLSEQGYVRLLSSALTEQALLGSLAFPLILPKAFIKSLLAAASETRDVIVARLPLPPLHTISDPGDQTLASFLTQHSERLALPETRVFTTLTLAREEANPPQPSTDELLALFEKRKDSWRQEEQRAYRQWVFFAKNEAEKTLSALEQGKNPKLAENTQALSVSARSQAEIPDSKLAQSLFALKTRGERVLVQGELGWYILELGAIVPPHTPRFAEKRSALLAEFLQEQQTARYLERLTEIEDMLLTATPLADIARRLKARTNTTERIDRQGSDLEGNPGAWAKGEDSWLADGFALREEGAVSKALEDSESEQTLYIQLTRLYPPQPPRLQQPQERARVLALYRGDRRREQGLSQAQELVKQAEQSSLESAAKKANLSYRLLTSLGRSSSDLPSDLLDTIFSTDLKTFLTYEDKRQEEYLVAQSESATRPKTFPAETLRAFTEQQQSPQLLLILYREALYRRAQVRIDEQQFSALFNSAQP